MAASATRRFTLVALAALLFAGFVALGTWQLQRRIEKLDLIERVEHKLGAEPVAPPPRERWTQIGAADSYTRLCLKGLFQHDHETLVQAVTERGPGFWVLTPLQEASGTLIWINRGFVPPERRDPALRGAAPSSGLVKVCGLLRLTEPRGGFLRDNDPATARWTSRDVAAMTAARQLPTADVAPYFVDADAAPQSGSWPVGGLTVVRFRNSHLAYALTWYGLALLTLVGAAIVIRYERRTQGRV